jgi:hypothetical protein
MRLLLRWNKFSFGVIDNLPRLHTRTSQGNITTKKKQFDEEQVTFVNIPC